jgi:cell division septum initiation protein DivIVA
MNEDVIDDLKQFIAATISQQISGLRQDFERLEHKVDAVDQKVDNLASAVAEALDRSMKRPKRVLTTMSVALPTLNTEPLRKSGNPSE